MRPAVRALLLLTPVALTLTDWFDVATVHGVAMQVRIGRRIPMAYCRGCAGAVGRPCICLSVTDSAGWLGPQPGLNPAESSQRDTVLLDQRVSRDGEVRRGDLVALWYDHLPIHAYTQGPVPAQRAAHIGECAREGGLASLGARLGRPTACVLFCLCL
jgi:hypothetical protein